MLSIKSKQTWKRSSLFLLLSTLIILMGGMLTVTWQLQHREATQAATGDVIGQPSLPAVTVDKILASLGSPMTGTGQIIEQAASDANIDDTFALGVWWTETNDGAAGVGRADRNPGSVKGSAGYPVAFDGYTIYPSYAAGITDWFNILKSRYVSRGLTSVYAIAHPYVGTSSSPLWAAKVVNLMLRYAGMAPPTPTPSPTAIPHEPVEISLGHNAAAQSTTPSQPKKMPSQSTATHGASIQATLSSSMQRLLLILNLLIATGVALLGFRIRRRLVEPSVLPFTAPLLVDEWPAASWAPQTSERPNTLALPPLYVNQYSPVAGDRYPEHPQPSWPDPVPPTPVFPVPVLTSSGGLLQRYSARSSAEGRPRRVVLRAQLPDSHESQSEQSTEGLSPSRSGVSLSGRLAEPVQPSGAGLLERYRDTSAKTIDKPIR